MLTQKKSNNKYYIYLTFKLNYPNIYTNILPQKQKPYITKTKYKKKQYKI